jgi:hypothetical protein
LFGGKKTFFLISGLAHVQNYCYASFFIESYEKLHSQKEVSLRNQTGLPDFSWSKHTKTERNIPNDHKLCQKEVNFTKVRKIFQMAIK